MCPRIYTVSILLCGTSDLAAGMVIMSLSHLISMCWFILCYKPFDVLLNATAIKTEINHSMTGPTLGKGYFH